MYNIDDYVYSADSRYGSDFCRIAASNVNKKLFGGWDYRVDYFDRYDNTYYFGADGLHIDEEDIERLLTEDEILEYEAKISANKYNL